MQKEGSGQKCCEDVKMVTDAAGLLQIAALVLSVPLLGDCCMNVISVAYAMFFDCLSGEQVAM